VEGGPAKCPSSAVQDEQNAPVWTSCYAVTNGSGHADCYFDVEIQCVKVWSCAAADYLMCYKSGADYYCQDGIKGPNPLSYKYPHEQWFADTNSLGCTVKTPP
jgi:hypothetical protein